MDLGPKRLRRECFLVGDGISEAGTIKLFCKLMENLQTEVIGIKGEKITAAGVKKHW